LGVAREPELRSAAFAERIDPDQLKLRAGWRLFRAHPAVGLDEPDGDVAHTLRRHELGVRWLALPHAEQAARERDFLRALMQRASVCADPAFEAGWARDPARTAALARRCGGSFTQTLTAHGALTEAAIDVLLDEQPEVCYFAGGEELVIDASDRSTGLCVWMDRWKARALERELLDSVWQAAQERAGGVPWSQGRQEVDRALRAHVLVAYDRHAYKAFVGAMAIAALLGLHPWGDRSFGAVAVRVALAVVALIALSVLVERWYQRSNCER
jgi:hypothetical protein